MDTLPFIMRRLEAARFHRLFATGSRSFDSEWLLEPEQVIFLGVGCALVAVSILFLLVDR